MTLCVYTVLKCKFVKIYGYITGRISKRLEHWMNKCFIKGYFSWSKSNVNNNT